MRRYCQRVGTSIFYSYVLILSCVLFVITVSERAFAQSSIQEGSTVSGVTQRERLEEERTVLEERLRMIRAQLESINQQKQEGQSHVSETQAQLQQQEAVLLQEVQVVETRITEAPAGVTQSTAPRAWIDNQSSKDFRESLESLPGITLRKRNGPRDFSISIRGFGAKQGFGVQKIKMYEDGFSLTQSDGLSRLDLPDPWFMEAVDVERGASSARHGNFALGGTINFRTRPGRSINGVETFLQGGSYGYQKYATAIGKAYTNVDAAVFFSHERGDGFVDHSDFDTTTVDANFLFKIDDRQSFRLKAANNDLEVLTPQRLTLGQFQANPKQAGTGAQANDRSRRDHRTIIGGQYSNQITPNTEVSLTGVYDNKDINQKFGIILDQVQPNWKTRADVRHNNTFFDKPLRSHVGVFFDYIENETTNFRNLADFFGSKQNAFNNQRGSIRNMGFRIREEWDFHSLWTVAAGVGYERSHISVEQNNFGFISGSFTSRANVNRTFHNVAPEVALVFHPNNESEYWGRVSGGYGIPNFGNLTTNSQGLPGANFALEDERNINFELGGRLEVHPRFRFEVVGFWTFFKDELISQTVIGGTGNFTTNADSSEYRGIEVGWEWLPMDGLTVAGAYTYVDARFINFTDSILVGGVGASANRDGNTVPAVEPHVFNLRTAYEHPTGLGGWVEISWLDDYFVNNANTLKAQAATVVNMNVHYTRDVDSKWVRFIKVFGQVDNLFNQTYMGSGAIVSDSTADANKQAFLLAPPISIFGGVTLGLF